MNARQTMRPLVAALGLALGATLAVVPAVQAQPAGHRMGMEPGGPHEGFMIERMLSGASNVTPAQREQIRQISKSARDDLRAQRETGRSLHERMRELLAQPNIDANAIEALRQQMLAQHDQASRRMTQAMVDAAKVLTPEQRQQIAAQAKARQEMRERHRNERRQLDAPASKG
jgi:periplasmic protein CpxP/Spy